LQCQGFARQAAPLCALDITTLKGALKSGEELIWAAETLGPMSDHIYETHVDILVVIHGKRGYISPQGAA